MCSTIRGLSEWRSKILTLMFTELSKKYNKLYEKFNVATVERCKFSLGFNWGIQTIDQSIYCYRSSNSKLKLKYFYSTCPCPNKQPLTFQTFTNYLFYKLLSVKGISDSLIIIIYPVQCSWNHFVFNRYYYPSSRDSKLGVPAINYGVDCFRRALLQKCLFIVRFTMFPFVLECTAAFPKDPRFRGNLVRFPWTLPVNF